jgi:formamidopyrimidine-DNA glycosylase
MPELPEVETTVKGLRPHCLNQTIARIQVFQPRLRWPIPEQIQQLNGAEIQTITRRAKYILMQTSQGNMIWHLGMSGSMRILDHADPSGAHEHVKIDFESGQSLRYIDPRRFGALLFTGSDPYQHPLIQSLGPEPLSDDFDTEYLLAQCKKRATAIKNVIMDSHCVVGIGNIYACESLFLAGINPKTRASRISRKRLQRLVDSIRQVLQLAINQGGTTLQDFTQTDGQPGYFAQSLNVYGNQGECPNCAHLVKRITQGQRSTFYCSYCQR